MKPIIKHPALLFLFPKTMKKLFCLVLIALTPSFIQAQKADSKGWPDDEQKTLLSANNLFDNRTFFLAYDKYKSLLDKHPNDIFLKYKTGICCVYISGKHEEALPYLDDVQKADKKAVNIDYYLALAYHRTYQFDRSLELASALLSNSKTDPALKQSLTNLINYNKNGKELIQNPLSVKIDNVGAPPNSEGAEYSPVVTSDEETMIFTYRGKESIGGLVDGANKPDPNGSYNEDIFITKKVDGVWQKAASIGDINGIENDAAIALSNDGQKLFVFKYTKEDKGDIYVSNLNHGVFSKPEKLKGDLNSKSWEGSITLSGDHKQVFFSSERPGGFGGKDLYTAYLQGDGSWGKVKNLGPKINTPLDEDAPFIHPDGRSLIFSSEGHNSMGGFDIFISDREDNDSTWKEATNVGYPVNTTDDDLFYVLSADGKRGYYSSAKKGGNGDQDIYVVGPAIVSKKSYVTIIKGKVTENLAPFECDITVTVLNNNTNYGVFKSNAESGHYVVNVPSGFNYKLSFYHPVLGDHIYDIITEKVDGYGEKVLNVTFGMNDTTSQKEQRVVVETKKDETVNTNTTTTASKPMTEADFVAKYGALKIPELTYYVQVCATEFPEKFDSGHLKKFCKVKSKGTIRDNKIHLIVADKEQSTLNDAEAFLKEIKSAPQPDAFITAYYKGQRYYLIDLFKMDIWPKE